MVVVEVVTVTEVLDCDVLVVGGGAAGLSGALTLARAWRDVVVVDSGEPRNAVAGGVHGLLGMDGIAPAELLERGRADVRRYGGRVVAGEVRAMRRTVSGFVAELAGGGVVRARKLLVATGLVDQLPDIPGMRERWGRDVLHCPYCHGWEVRGGAVGVVATGPMSVHQALLWTQWTPDLVFFRNGVEISDEQGQELAARGVRVVDGEVVAVVGEDKITGVRLADGTSIARETIVVAPSMVARVGFLAGLGLSPVEHPMGRHLAADAAGRTDVPGVWVAGNAADLAAHVVVAAAAGVTAAAGINAELVREDTVRAPFDARTEAEVTTRVLGDRRHGLAAQVSGE
ncbi:NAD(P)/FAD-dependent oxidoreductase [Actinokineospora diospyrosa]|nr:NAD(P)/FAD-dependent oxidoreductase [Actinokineospora diospyrosa]